MNYRYLEAFLSAVSEMSFTKAASQLNVTPAAIGRQVKLLEESLGKQLIIRSPQSFTITPDGKELYTKAMTLDGWIKSNFFHKSHETIRILALQGIIENWLVDRLQATDLKDDISFNIFKGEPADTEKFLLENKVDFAITNQEFNNETLSSRKIFSEEIALVSNKKINLKEIGNHRWVITNSKDYIINYAAKNQIKHVGPTIKIESIRASIDLISSGVGISMMPIHLVKNNKKLHIKKISDFDSESIYLTSLNYKRLPEHLMYFASLIN